MSNQSLLTLPPQVVQVSPRRWRVAFIGCLVDGVGVWSLSDTEYATQAAAVAAAIHWDGINITNSTEGA